MQKILSVSLLCVCLAACGGDKQTGPAAPEKAPAVNLPANAIVVAGVREVRPSFEYPAVVEAVQLARVRPEISAVVAKIHFSPGQTVEKGDLLLEFDASTYQADYDASVASLESAQASYEQAQSNWDRAEELMPQGYISQQDYDKAQAALDGSRASVTELKARVARAKLDLAHTRIYAPFRGKISKPFYAIGESVIPNSPNSPQPLFTLVEMDPIYVTAGVQLAEYHKFVLLRKNMEDRGVVVPQLGVELRLAGGEAYPYEGTFEAWDNTSNQGSGTVTGRLLFPNPDGLLLPGNNVTIHGEALRSFRRVLIPQKAVMQDQQGYYVRVVDEGNKVARRNVELGIRYKDEWIVLDGLEEGAKVITMGAQMLKEGASVNLQQ